MKFTSAVIDGPKIAEDTSWHDAWHALGKHIYDELTTGKGRTWANIAISDEGDVRPIFYVVFADRKDTGTAA